MVADAMFAGELKHLSGYGSAVHTHGAVAADRPSASRDGVLLSLLSWNLLAPPYKRPRESEQASRSRALAQIALVRESAADVIGLQEFWLEQEHMEAWSNFAESEGYCMLVSPRTGGKPDGCCMLVRRRRLTGLPSMETYSFDDWGNRILQCVTLQLAGCSDRLMLAHTHLTFPHANGHDPQMRRHQARKLATWVREQRSSTPHLALFGDLNGDVHDPAVSQLLQSAELAPMSGETDWVSHLSHLGTPMACDLVATAEPAAGGGVRVGEWSFGGSAEELLAGTWLSDHRPLYASLVLDSRQPSDSEPA